MLPKYTVEFTAGVRNHARNKQYCTDDPIACVEFVEEVLDHGFALRSIKHEGLALPRHDFDKVVKTAAGLLASKRICASLSLKPDEEQHRFGFPA